MYGAINKYPGVTRFSLLMLTLSTGARISGLYSDVRSQIHVEASTEEILTDWYDTHDAGSAIARVA